MLHNKIVTEPIAAKYSSPLQTTDVMDVAEDSDQRNKPGTPFERLPKLLRRIGGIILLASALTFLVTSWVDATPLGRYYSFLGFTLVLTAAGTFCALRLKEDKGARTFLTLGAAFLPAHFAQLGAFLYANYLGRAQRFETWLELFQFSPIDPLSLTLTLGVACAALTLVAFTGFSSMARTEANRLTLLYMISNVALLLPTRDPNLVALIGLVLLALLVITDIRRFSGKAVMNGFDGLAVRTMLFVPVLLLIGRSMVLYSASDILVSELYAIATGLLFFGIPKLVREKDAKEVLQGFSMLPLFLACNHFVDAFAVPNSILFQQFAMAMVVLPYAIIVAGLSFVAVSNGRCYRILAASSAMGVGFLQLLVVGGVLSSLLCIIVAVAVTISAFAMEEKWLFYIGTTGLAVGILYHIRYAYQIYEINPWLSLAITGASIIMISSYVERYSSQLVNSAARFRARLGHWN